MEELLGGGGSDDTGTSGSRDESDSNGTALSSDLSGNGMDITDLVTPIASSDGNERELGSNEGTLDGDLNFLGDFHTESDVTILITNSDDGLESGSLTGLSLLLDGDDLHDLIREFLLGSGEELIDDLGFLDGDGVSVDFLKRLDKVVLDESSELGKGSPVLVVTSAASSGSTTSASAAASSTASSEATSASSFSTFGSGLSSSSRLLGCSTFFHLLLIYLIITSIKILLIYL